MIEFLMDNWIPVAFLILVMIFLTWHALTLRATINRIIEDEDNYNEPYP